MADHDDAPRGELKTPRPSDGDAAVAPEHSGEAGDVPEVDDQAATEAVAGADHVDDEVGGDEPGPETRSAMALGVVVVLILAGLAGVFGFGAYESGQSEQQEKLYLQVARQGALNLTTIDHADVEADIQRILGSATGIFYEDFQQRAPAFIQVVKQAQSKTVGTITEAGLESVAGASAQALVAVSVQTSNAGAAEQQPRNWRMRIEVQKVDGALKVSNVGFVP